MKTDLCNVTSVPLRVYPIYTTLSQPLLVRALRNDKLKHKMNFMQDNDRRLTV